MTLSELTNELKVELLNASDATYDENMWLSIEEIHRIRIGISKIDDFEFDKSKLSFFDSCVSFSDIYLYFYHSEEAEFNQYYLPKTETHKGAWSIDCTFFKT